MHVVRRDGTVTSAGDAVIELMRVFPRSRPVAFFARLLPPVRRRIARRYEATAARRGQLSERVPDTEVTVVRPRWIKH